MNKSTAPVPCETGWYSPGGKMACEICPTGHMCPNVKSANLPIPCINGTYSNVTGSSDCRVCPAGFMCLDPRHAPVSCVEGFYSPLGIPQCLLCPQGHR